MKPTLLDERRAGIDVFKIWLVRLVVALLFISVGAAKFRQRSPWVEIFDQIGFGVWFRYFTGTLQIAGAVLVLIPRTFAVGIGDPRVHDGRRNGVMGIPAWRTFNAIIPGGLLCGLLLIGGEALMDFLRGRQLRTTVQNSIFADKFLCRPACRLRCH